MLVLSPALLKGGVIVDFVKTYAKRLQAFRIVAGLSQSGLAAKSGISIWAIQGYEHGRNVPSLEIAAKLARALGQPLEAFLPSEGEDAGAVKAKASKPKSKKG